MPINQAGIDLIKKYEGSKLQSYYDTGNVLTIGVGHTGPDVKAGMTITQEQADALLVKDLAEAVKGVKALVIVPLNENELAALASFVYNLGSRQFSKSTLLRKLNKGDKAGVVKEFGKWIYDNEKKLQGLINRRKEESELFVTPSTDTTAKV